MDVKAKIKVLTVSCYNVFFLSVITAIAPPSLPPVPQHSTPPVQRTNEMPPQIQQDTVATKKYKNWV